MDENNHHSRSASGPLPGSNGTLTSGSVAPVSPPAQMSTQTVSQTNGRVPVAAGAKQTIKLPGYHAAVPRPDVHTSAKMLAIHRTRVNRLLMRKRRHVRLSKDLGSRVMKVSVIVLLVGFCILSGTVGAALAYYQAQLPLLNGIANHSLFQTTRIYDRNDRLLYELYDHGQDHGRRTYINYSDLSTNTHDTSQPLIVQATVAAEDRTFWDNSGIDLQGIARAAFENLQNQSVIGGGSTITQQLIKNQFFLNQPRTLQVKMEEAILAYGLTQQYPKWKIMEMYLNTVYYGDLNYGIEAAAQGYFNLQPKCTQTRCIPASAQLNLAQASFLAGLPQSPSYYDPLLNYDTKTHVPQASLDRQKQVLDAMVSLGMITPAQAAQAEKEMATYRFRPYADTHGMQAPHFVRYIIDEVLVPLFGAQNLLNGGYNIYTTIDLDLEKAVEKSVYNHLYTQQVDSYLGVYGPLDTTNNVNNAAVVVMNPSTGEILAMDGSVKFDNTDKAVQGQYNAALALRQPGSSFKPIVYATAFEMGWYPAMIIPDHKTTYPGNTQPPYYSPQNYDGKFHTGFPMTVRNAIANSFNIPAIDALEFAGIPNVLNMAGRLGLSEVASRKTSSLGPSMALGTAEVSLLHLTGAYATFANGGVHVPPTSILEITDSQGHPLYTYNAAHPQGVRAMRADVAFLMTSILSDKASRYHEFSPGNPLELNRPAAAKTGTTESFRDNWTMGYTPYLTVGVWAGNSDNSPMNNVIGITGAGPIWHDVMTIASQRYHYPADDFTKPDTVHSGTVSAYTGLLPHAGEATVTDWFIDGTMPTIQGPMVYTNPQRCRGNNCVPPCRGNNCPPRCGDVCRQPG